MGANLVGFVLGVDGAQYFAHELISSWAGMSCFRDPLLPPLIETFAGRNSLPAWGLCVFVRRRTTHVRVQVMDSVVIRGLSYRLLGFD
jgi:hypothetical protein